MVIRVKRLNCNNLCITNNHKRISQKNSNSNNNFYNNPHQSISHNNNKLINPNNRSLPIIIFNPMVVQQVLLLR